jgi:hypothetical protein
MPVSVRANRSALSPSIAAPPFSAAVCAMPVCSCRRTRSAYAPPARQPNPFNTLVHMPRLQCDPHGALCSSAAAAAAGAARHLTILLASACMHDGSKQSISGEMASWAGT